MDSYRYICAVFLKMKQHVLLYCNVLKVPTGTCQSPQKMDGRALASYSGCLHRYFGTRILNVSHSAVVGNKLVVAGQKNCLARTRIK